MLEGRSVVFEGTFNPEGYDQFTTETPLTGNGARDKASVIALARQRFPEGRMNLVSTRIFTRSNDSAPSFKQGTTLGQLFGEAGSPTEVAVEIGHVFFDGARCQISLRNLRSRNSVTFALRQPSGGSVNFSNQIHANRLASELPIIAKEVFGQNVRELTITLKQEAL